jgi:hypothetical protein
VTQTKVGVEEENKNMNNKITELFKSISDSDLKLVMQEMKESESTGYIGDLVREYVGKTVLITGNNVSTDLYMVQINLFKEAAFRWLNN